MPKKFHDHILSSKLFFRGAAIISIVALAIATSGITYKASIEVWDFLNMHHIVESTLGRRLSAGSAILIGIATIVQSAPTIWDKLSYWGQLTDNFLNKLIFKREYFLDESEEILNQIRKLINRANTRIQEIAWMLLTKNLPNKELNDITNELNEIINYELTEAYGKHYNVVKILKANEAYDPLNRQRKDKAKMEINSLTGQISNTCVLIKTIGDWLQQKR